MSKNADHRWIYRFLDSEKQTEGVLKDIIDRLESEYPRTIWNIAYIVESTAKLCFIKHGQPFDVVKDTVRKMCGEKKIDCQVSLEEKMACGIGACLGCAVKVKRPRASCFAPVRGKQDFIYKLACKDGPVFNANEIIW